LPGSERDLTGSVVLAVDGGNSKTDLALVRDDGRLLAHVRGPLSSPHHLGLEGALATLERMLDDALAAAGRERTTPVVDIAELFLAGVDFPSEEEQVLKALEERRWAAQTVVGNDTFAVLRAGTDRGWGVAVVCGAGINCVAVAPDGRVARFPSLGAITGDWGGGYDVGLAALSAAARSEDRRGPETSLERTVPGYFGFETPLELASAIHAGKVTHRRLIELAPLVLESCSSDGVAAEIVDRLAEEVVTMVRSALGRLGLEHETADVVLGGGLLAAGNGRLLDAIAAGLSAVGPQLVVRPTNAPPVVGAALLGLDALGAGPDAHANARRALAAAVGVDDELGAAVEPATAGEAVGG
jgi:N-acetylglucosamine kinase-like BadF-type ATPase